MSKWPMVPLGEVLVKSTEQIEIQPHKSYYEVTVRLWGKGVDLRREVTGSEIKADKRFKVAPGQFIVSRIDARNGAFGLIPEQLNGAIVSNDFPVFNTNKQKLAPAFLSWLSKTSAFVDLCRRASEGTTNRVRLKENLFLEMEIPLPPLSEQQKIVEWIDSVAARVEEARELNERTNELCQGFVSSLHDSLSEDGGTKMKDFLELCEEKVSVESEMEYPQIGIRGFGGGMFFRETLRGDQTQYKHFNRLEEGLIVLSQVKGWEGAIAVTPTDLDGHFSSPEYRTFRCKDTVLDEYLATLIPSPWFWQKLEGLTRGVGARRERIRPEMFLDMDITMPSLANQRKAIEMFRCLDEAKTLHKNVPEQLDSILPSILNHTFNGGEHG